MQRRMKKGDEEQDHEEENAGEVEEDEVEDFEVEENGKQAEENDTTVTTQVSSRRTVYEIVRSVERRTLAMKIDACNAKGETCYSGRTECVEVGGRGRS